MLKNFDKFVYPSTLGVGLIIAIIVFLYTHHLKKTNRKFEKIMAWYILIHETLTLFVFYLSFGRGDAMLITDLSPFVFVASMLPLFTGKFYKIRKMLMPWLIISALITMSLGKPGFSADPTGKDLSHFIESFATYIKHLVILIVGIYFLFTTPRYKGKEILFVFAVPFVLLLWIFIAGGSFYYATDNPRYGLASTTVFLPTTLPWGLPDIVLSNSEHNEIIQGHPTWDQYFIQKSDKSGWTLKALQTTSLWGKTYNLEPGTYVIINKLSRIIGIPYYVVSAIFASICVAVGTVVILISNLGHHKKADTKYIKTA